MVNAMVLPVIRAAIDLRRNKPDSAQDLLQATIPYDAGASFWHTYLRGQAYLRLNEGAKAAVEFQKILDHRGWDYALSTFIHLHSLD